MHAREFKPRQGYNSSLRTLYIAEMPDFLTLRGRNALSDFRLKKLSQPLQKTAPAISGILSAPACIAIEYPSLMPQCSTIFPSLSR